MHRYQRLLDHIDGGIKLTAAGYLPPKVLRRRLVVARRKDASIAYSDSKGMIAMSTLTIRGFDDELHARLRVQAARHGRSMEAEVRAVLADYLSSPHTSGTSDRLGSRMHARFASLEDAELELPTRDDMPRAAVFE